MTVDAVGGEFRIRHFAESAEAVEHGALLGCPAEQGLGIGRLGQGAPHGRFGLHRLRAPPCLDRQQGLDDVADGVVVVARQPVGEVDQVLG